jgi:acyl carrier protein
MSNDQCQMSNDELRNNIRKLVAKIVKLPEEKVNFDADLFNDLNVDSLVGLEIFAALDKQYGIDVPEDRLRQLNTLDDLAQLVAELLAGKKQR